MDNEKNECSKILTQLKVYLDKHRLKEIEEFMDDNVYNEIEQDIELKFDITILICQRLRTLNKFRFKTFEMCQNLLIEIANRCNAKEMLLAFLAELENGTLEQESNGSSSDEETKNSKTKSSTKSKTKSKTKSITKSTTNEIQASPKKLTKSSFDNCVKSLFTPLKIVINRIPNQKEANLKWVLGILNCHLLKITISSKSDQLTEIDFKKFNELNQTTLERFDFLLPDYLNFLSEFVDQYSTKEYKLISAKYSTIKLTLIKALLSILYHPLMHLDLSIDETNVMQSIEDLDKDIIGLTSTKDNLLSELKGVKCFKQNCRIYSYQIVNLISRLEPNIFDLYQLEHLLYKDEANSSLKLTEELIKYSFGVQAYICYVLLNENLLFVPSSIYSPIYVFTQHLPYIIVLLERTEPFVCDKGLHLIDRLIFKIPDFSLKASFLDFLREHSFDKSIIKIMRFSAVEEHRRKAYKIFNKLVRILDCKARYNYIFKTMAEPNQFNGIRGLMITFYKDFIFDKERNQEFIGINLQNFIRLVIDQQNLVPEEFDLIENMDSLMSFLNFIRFLLLWDKKLINQTGVFNELKEIELFSDKLQKKIEFCSNYLKIKINAIKINDQTKKKDKKIVFDIKCANGDDKLSDLFNNMSEKEELNMFEQGLANLDLISNVQNRVIELISICK